MYILLTDVMYILLNDVIGFDDFRAHFFPFINLISYIIYKMILNFVLPTNQEQYTRGNNKEQEKFNKR